MILRTFSVILIFLFFIAGCSTPTRPIPRDIASLNANGEIIGVWFLQGTSSVHGPYNGDLELRPAGDGTYDVIRIVTYINYFYDGLRVQEVWQGKGVADEDTLTITYDLKQGEFITKVPGLAKSTKELQTPLTVNMRFFPTPSGLEAKFSDKRASDYSEWITTKRPLDKHPLWVDERKYISEPSAAVPLAEKKKVQAAQKVLNYGKDPFIQAYKNRSDFKTIQPRIVQDRTDLSFYKSQPNVLRLVNKVTDAATIAETVLKRNAYYPSLEDKASRYDEAIFKNFSPYNLLVVRRGSNEKEAEIDMLDTDSVFTTGFYLASQSIRYQVTKSPEVFLNMQRALNGLLKALEVSQGKSQIAAAMAPIPLNQVLPPRWMLGSGAYSQTMWSADNQELSYVGLIHGLVWAAVSIPETQVDLQKTLKTVTEILRHKDQSSWSQTTRGAIYGLVALIFKDALAEKNFSLIKPPAKGFYWNGNADWNREFVTLIEATYSLQIARALGNLEKESEWKNFMAAEYQVYAAAKRPLRILTTQYLLPGIVKNKEDLNWIWQKLEEVPYPRIQEDLTIDHSGDARWSPSPIPRYYWSVADKSRQGVQYYYQGLLEVPVFELLGYTSRFIWKENGFEYRSVSPGKIEATGVDYLYAYWLLKHSGVFNRP